MVDGRTLREIMPILPLTFQFNSNLKPEDWKDMNQVLQIHQLLKELSQWGMKKKVQPSITLGRTWAKLPEDFSKRETFKKPNGNHQRLESQEEVQNP
ncbi:hypothetical protein O181_085552 [Austropuccinia psidii MF-1]|uniref:Uncharacterized protein n=1 Tax=Austropuccinia psidii MF-1 TaxID=1389203 RepID=A0A9Q3FY85_9BASI|nr:hypothetical protein [Austropuccinia psidii MF-1]